MTKKTPTLHRWALLDKRGKTRMVCDAESTGAAHEEFISRRNGRGLPRGWIIVLRGPVGAKTECQPKVPAMPDPKSEPRPLKVGDRVRRVGAAQGDGRLGQLGTVTDVTVYGNVVVQWDSDKGKAMFSEEGQRCLLQLVDPAEEQRGRIAELEAKVKGQADLLVSAGQRLVDLQDTLDGVRRQMEAEKRRATSVEEKLADIKLCIKADSVIRRSALPDGSTLSDIIQYIINK